MPRAKAKLFKTVAIPEPLFKLLDTWAKAERRSKANLIGLILEKAVNERKKQKEEEAAKAGEK